MPRRALLLLVILALAAPAARAQFVQYTPPGDFQGPAEARDEAFEAALRDARFKLGRLYLDPWVALRNVSYQSTSSGEAGRLESDLTATLGAGVNAYVPIGADFIWGAWVLPEYVWWRKFDDRRRLNGRYGTGLFGNLGRIGLEGSVSRTEDAEVFSREVEERTNQRRDQAKLDLTLDVGKGFLLFARGTLYRFRSLEDQEPLASLSTLDRDETLYRAGVGYRAERGWTLGLGFETSEAEFQPGSLTRSNSGESIVLEYSYSGPYFTLSGNVAQRSLEPENDSEFIAFDGPTFDFNLSGRPLGPVLLELFGRRNVSYSLQASTSYVEYESVGLGLTSSIGSVGSVRSFVEWGEGTYVDLEPADPQRIDDSLSYGLTFSFRYRRAAIVLGATRTDYDSTVPEGIRTVDRITTSVVIGGSLGSAKASPWS